MEVMKAVLEAQKLLKKGISLHRACKQAGTTPVTFEKYIDDWTKDPANMHGARRLI